MKRSLIAIVLLALASPLFAQTATLNTPTTRTSEAKILIVDFTVKRDCACAMIIAEVQDASNNALRTVRYDVPDSNVAGSSLSGLLGAMEVTRATETGTNARKMNYRVLGYLADTGYFTTTPVTLAP